MPLFFRAFLEASWRRNRKWHPCHFLVPPEVTHFPLPAGDWSAQCVIPCLTNNVAMLLTVMLHQPAKCWRKILTCLFYLCLVVLCMSFPNVCGKRKKIIFFAARMTTLKETCAFHVIKEDEQESKKGLGAERQSPCGLSFGRAQWSVHACPTF